MRELGPIARLQIQKNVLRTGPDRNYGTEGLLEQESLTLTADGVLARQEDIWVLDRHHRSHPQNAHGSPDRALSVGFTSHYDLMSDRFGPTPLGAAGENIIVQSSHRISLDDIAGGLVVQTAAGDVELKAPAIAEPCVPFTKFMLGDHHAPVDIVKPNRDFLRAGMRGFVMGTASLAEPVEVRVGDMVLAV